MNSDISAVQCGKAPELILLSKCQILLKDFFSRPLSPQELRQLNACGCSRSVTVMLSTDPAEDLLHRAVLPFQQWRVNNAFTLQWELHPNTQETANERADDNLAGEENNKNPTHFLDMKLQPADAPHPIKEHQRCCACSHTELRYTHFFTTRLYSHKQQNKQIKALKILQLHFTPLTITSLRRHSRACLLMENRSRNLQVKRYSQLISETQH